MSDQNQQGDIQSPGPSLPQSEAQASSQGSKNIYDLTEPVTYTKDPRLTKIRSLQGKISGSGKTIATILGFAFLFLGIASGVQLAQQQQYFEQKAAAPTGTPTPTPFPNGCHNACSPMGQQDGCKTGLTCGDYPPSWPQAVCINPQCSSDTDCVCATPAATPI